MGRTWVRWCAAALFGAAWSFLPFAPRAEEGPPGAALPADSPGAPAAADAGPPALLEIVFFDVRQGDSTLITTPDGRHILVDGGVCRTDWNRYDAAERVILPFLRKEGIRRLDLVIGTHPDFDHIGGLSTVLADERIGVGCYLDPGKDHDTQVYRRLLKKVEARGIPYRKGRAGMKLNLGPGVEAEILSPHNLLENTNDCSIVLRVRHGRVSFLLTGDAEENAELRMESNYGRRIASTVLKAGHHGSRNSSGDSFLEAVRPRMAVISVGARNRFGHPHKETLERLEAAGARILRTDEMGTIVMRSDGKNLTVNRLRSGAPAPPAKGGGDAPAR